MIGGYYFLVFCASATLILAACSSLLVYRISSVLTPVLCCMCLLGILCCMLRFLHIREALIHCSMSCKAELTGRKKARHIGLWILTEALLIVLGFYPLFPFWLKSLFLAPALALLLCMMLWNSKLYRKFKLYSKFEEVGK